MSESAPPVGTELNKPPGLIWTLTETRVLFELLSFRFARPLFNELPKGDGHSVMVIPGFLGTDSGTKSLRGLLSDMNYDAHGWGLGQNLTFSDARLDAFADQVEDLYHQSGRKVTLVGWSMGGMFAREMTKRYPNHVRNVITMGSPISGNFSHTFAYKIYCRINGEPSAEEQDYYKTLFMPPPVPCSSIYSKSDGIVAWRNSLQHEGPLSENIRVLASHCGMGSNPAVMNVLIDRIAQPEGEWTRFDRATHRRLFKRRKNSLSPA